MMSRTKKWIIAAAILVAVGGVIFLGALAAVGFDASRLETWGFHTNTYEFTDDFNNISINSDIAGVTILPSDDGVCRVVCYEDDTISHAVKVENDTLSIESVNTRKWYNNIGISIDDPSVTVYLPEETYTSVSVTVTTGNITLENVISDSLDAAVTTGNISLKACDAGEMNLEARIGNIEGTVLSDKIFVATADLGNVSVPATTSGGICRATTEIGEIKLEIE